MGVVDPAGASRAHPRVGGENVGTNGICSSPSGSSPRGRGKLVVREQRARGFGLIPAWAGKTFLGLPFSSSTTAHPRVGGENARVRRLAVLQPGSSPRGRGKRKGLSCRRDQERLIPAWAGKTSIGRSMTSYATAHPRVGGENTVRVTLAIVVRGSSPRGRGKPTPMRWVPTPTRLIPAWAGKTVHLLHRST